MYRRRSGAAEFGPPAETRAAGKARLDLLGLEIDLDRLFVD
jgi:hypothetical protein